MTVARSILARIPLRPAPSLGVVLIAAAAHALATSDMLWVMTSPGAAAHVGGAARAAEKAAPIASLVAAVWLGIFTMLMLGVGPLVFRGRAWLFFFLAYAALWTTVLLRFAHALR